MGFYIVFTTLVFGFVLFNVINNKKFSFVSFFLFILLVLFYCIKKFDPEYYLEMVKGIENIDLYSIVASAVSFVVSCLEYYIGYKKHNKKLDNIALEMNKVNRKPVTEYVTIKDQNTDNLLIYLEMMDEPLACYVNGKYIINNMMKRILRYNDYSIEKNDFSKYINFRDKQAFLKNSDSNTFRINGTEENDWFEETTVKIQDNEYRLVRRARNLNVNKIKLRSFKELNNCLNEYMYQNKEYYLVFFDIVNTIDISAFYGKDFTDLVVSKFLTIINNLPYVSQTKIFYISSTEYVLVLDDKIEYNILVSELENNNSALLSSTIFIGESKVIVNSKVGVVASKDVKNNDVSNVIDKGFEMVKLAINSNYPGNYAIYHKVDNSIDYSAKDLNIDLDIDLNQYKKKIK